MYEYRAKVLRVIDGDTIDVEIDLGFKMFMHTRVRFSRIDAWEVRGEERVKGLIAKEFVVQTLANMPDTHIILRTEKDKQGKYGRYIADILVPQYDENAPMNLNDEMVKEGHATYWEY